MSHIMLDLETWGTRAGCDLRSIGAVVFDPITGWVPDPTVPLAMVNDCPIEPRFYLATDNRARPSDADPTGWHFDDDEGIYRKYPLKRDPKTIKWWSEQSDEARAAFTNPVDLREALVRFGKWLYALVDTAWYPEHHLKGVDVKIWAHGSHFDVPILEAAYHAVDLPVPWHYRSPRDTRTIFDAAKIDDHSGWLDLFSTGTHHHALDDAICQARAVCAAFKVLRI